MRERKRGYLSYVCCFPIDLLDCLYNLYILKTLTLIIFVVSSFLFVVGSFMMARIRMEADCSSCLLKINQILIV